MAEFVNKSVNVDNYGREIEKEAIPDRHLQTSQDIPENIDQNPPTKYLHNTRNIYLPTFGSPTSVKGPFPYTINEKFL